MGIGLLLLILQIQGDRAGLNGYHNVTQRIVEASLNLDNISLGFSRFKGENPICLITDACKRSDELPGSTNIHLTSKSLTPNVRIRAL